MIPSPSAGAAGSRGSRLRLCRLNGFRLAAGRRAARRFTDFLQLRERTLAVNGAFAIGVESLPRHALRVGNPLLVGLGIAAGRIFGLNGRTFGAAQALIDFGKLRLIFGL